MRRVLTLAYTFSGRLWMVTKTQHVAQARTSATLLLQKDVHSVDDDCPQGQAAPRRGDGITFARNFSGARLKRCSLMNIDS